MAALSAVSPILERFEVVCARIDAEVTRLDQPLLRQLQQQTGLRYAYLILGASFLLFAFIFLGFGAAFFSHIIGFLYPAYASFKAIESATTDDDKQWVRASPDATDCLPAVRGRCRIRLPSWPRSCESCHTVELPVQMFVLRAGGARSRLRGSHDSQPPPLHCRGMTPTMP